MNWNATIFIILGILVIIVGFRGTLSNIWSTFGPGAAPATKTPQQLNVCSAVVNGKTVQGVLTPCLPGFCNIAGTGCVKAS